VEPLSLDFLCTMVEGRRVGGDGDITVQRVVTDSRHVRPGDLFVCLVGDRFDGHEYADQAMRAGAEAVLVHRDDVTTSPALVVSDTLTAFGQLGRAVRVRARLGKDPIVVAVTGTNGKTGTKDLAAAALGCSLATVGSRASFNNDIGVPITLLDMEPETEAVVVEVGSNAPGEIKRLAGLVEPEVAVITNVHPGHLEGLTDLEGVLEEKASLLDGLTGRQIAILNRDDSHFEALRDRAPGEVITFGHHPSADLHALDVRCAANGTDFRVNDGRTVRLAHLGRHSVLNALAALACARVAGVDPVAAAAALGAVPPPPGRLQLRKMGRLTVLDDSYNANPGSLAAAAATLNEVGLGGRRVFVVGDMLELGSDASSLHRAAGRTLANAGPELLVAVGRHAEEIVKGAVEAGVEAGNCVACADRDCAVEVLEKNLVPGDVVLVKGSRGMALDALIRNLDTEATAVS
jgi:UDP-N-acetylmuramoyl-tripeptide--D-alanyl-D-alanine ligase